MQLTFRIQSSGAWSPRYQQIADWQQWPHSLCDEDHLASAPTLPQVPAMQRRRFSRLTKMLLDAAFQCDAPAQCRTIFASRHGELNRTVELLEDIVQEQPISPIGFSQSVHNTASGIFSILTHNRAASTSIAASETTLEQALTEAYGQLCEDNSDVLLVFGDEPVSDVYKEFIHEPELPIAIALQLSLPTPDSPPATLLQLHTQPSAEQYRDAPPMSYGQLLHAIAGKHPLYGRLNRFIWQLSHG